MTMEEAHRIVGPSPTWATRNMAVALSIHSWGNSPAEWRRLEAACVILGRAAPARSVSILTDYKADLAAQQEHRQ